MVKSHVECSSELVWQCVKKNNAYVRASVNRTRLSAEKGNVTAKHGFSSSGASFFVCNFFIFLVRFFPLFSLLGSSSAFVARKGTRAVRRRAGANAARGSLFLFFALSLSLYRASGCARPHTHTSTKQNFTPPKKEKRSNKRAFLEKKKAKTKEKKRERERLKKKRGEEKKNKRRRKERKKARRRRSRPLPSENIKFEDGIGMNASGIARSDQFERKDAFAR